MSIYWSLKNWLLIFFVSLGYEWKNRRAHFRMAGVARHTMCTSVVLFIPQGKRKKSTVSSYNLISCYIHTKSKGKQPWNKTKFKLNRKRKNKLTNGHGGVIIQRRAAIFERIRNAQIKAVQTVSFSLLSVTFPCALRLWFKRCCCDVVYNDITRDSIVCLWRCTMLLKM